jgi:hypothetical protein
MGASSGVATDGGVIADEDSPITGGVFSGLGPYRWVAWFVVVEAFLLVVAVSVDQILGAPILGGLIASFTVLIAITGGLGVVALILYRLVFGRQ